MDSDSESITPSSPMDFVGTVLITGALLYLVLLLTSRTVRFRTKYYLYNLCYPAIGLVSIPFMLLKPGDVDNVRWPALFTRLTVKHLFGIKVSATGLEHLKSDKPYIAVCNHQSTIDHIAMMEFWPNRCSIMMKNSVKYLGPMGIAAMLSGIIFVCRTNREKAKEALENTVKVIKEKNAKVWVFPEGTRKLSKKNRPAEEKKPEYFLPFKKGAFNLAVQAQVPIVPVVFSCQESFFSFRHKRFTSGAYKMTVLKPVPTVGMTLDDVPDFTEKIRDMMIKTFIETSALSRDN
ncbi:1-acyl-sn-glycerol-3-phosphate acyltransferase alpha-like [Acanthaster planci]|uniref:1-acyl-sn-glycerol-3-phosphate acyltransferase n=1 Tax=Acanthaster planci TaxID=133434 RepID=A0A8B7XTW6_ACAPL|nr:1-acyl-sn-glycerol-3-phosphate acyltransferase alpha-like [Acanthaster planci]XP_022084297.1 1-acyl-sn-glycerol-3-phosphate acyltransferase alpha-like [Acanthaster planci]XP_022084298.1 1-acyl-sn-glycerol-3-phosphate acyltransferase alpha-like [Acanthaster planci]XP_022084299.1 1-acyl-sn-glycerol-3-phosphate acyltransferase alpha-like [Acanthaster planci]